MLTAVLEAAWILDVAAISEKTGSALARARNESDRRNAQMNGDLRLERVDAEYSARARANSAHHVLPRTAGDLPRYLADVLRSGEPPNVVGLYALFHAAALARAARFPPDDASAERRAAEARLLLALESFALHFLEDAFAAGHVAGLGGPTAVLKGTHDYYNEHGIDTDTWDHEPLTLYGDGHMGSSDLDRAAAAVRVSFEQILGALVADASIRSVAEGITLPSGLPAGVFGICRLSTMPGWAPPPGIEAELVAVLRLTPMPFRGPDHPSLPRFRAEIGPFVGVVSGFQGEGADGGFAADREGGLVGSMDVGLRLGVGIDALLGDSGDGLVFVQGGIVLQSRSSGGCGTTCPSDPLLSQFVPGLPARSAMNFRLRMPFWLIPGDLLLAAPVLGLTNPALLEKMAIVAADGGLIPWQTKLSTPIGSLQFVAGREVGVDLFGYLGGRDAFVAAIPGGVGAPPTFEPVAVRSIEWNFPILELRPLREYGTRYSFATFLQLGVGFDTPFDAESLVPGRTVPPLKTRYFGFIRIFFDGRRYF
jgi:hypothetical protein